MPTIVEYIWMDGVEPTQKLRSKTRVFSGSTRISLESLPNWGFDGSSTNQATGDKSDLVLKPVALVPVSLPKSPLNYLVMCEVMNPDGTPHKSNTRAKLKDAYEIVKDQEPWIGFEQEYTLMKKGRPLGWPEDNGHYPAPQGKYYCGVGADEVAGRILVESHLSACLASDLMIYGVNAEVMLGQWEYQIGYRGNEKENSDPLTISDHLWLSRWLLYKIGEGMGISATLDPKPVRGDWNGAGAHTNFSTKKMREEGGLSYIEQAVKSLREQHDDHIDSYGHDLQTRLTGLHETCDINTFKSGVGDRGASVRIPAPVSNKKCGYFEDRRPGANMDPYVVSTKLLETVCM